MDAKEDKKITYLQLAAMLASRLNGDTVSLSMEKQAIIYKRYGVSQYAEREAPVKLVVSALSAKNKMAALEKVVRQIFTDAGENYPNLNFNGLMVLGHVVVDGLREGAN